VCAADLLIRHKHPGTFRIHAVPTEEKLLQLRTFLKLVGLNLGGGAKPTARDYAEVMQRIKERPDAALLQTMLLRSMQQAVYSPDNVGHFGLAYEAYAHFTSPIRRYPDLLTHRAIKAILQGKKYEPKGIEPSTLNTTLSNSARKQAAKDKAEGKSKKEQDLTIWDALGVHCSANERRADEASRDVENWLKCYFMQDKLGEDFTGTVSGVTPFGIFVTLDQLYVEGLVHISGLGTDYFQYDEARHELRGERGGQVYKLTDKVKVKVARVDLESRKIDLALADTQDSIPAPLERARQAAVDALEPKPPRARKGKAAASAASAPVEPSRYTSSAAEDVEEDVVFVPPPRPPRKPAAKTGAKTAANAEAKKTASKTPTKRAARSDNASAPKTRAEAKTPAAKTSRKKK
jgi:ribonuclease R